MSDDSLTDWKNVSSQKDEEIKELKAKISELVKKNLQIVKEKSDLESKLKAMEDVANNFEKYATNVQSEVEKIESVWKAKVLEGHRKIRALEKLLDDKRKKDLDMKSLTLQKYVQTYKDKITELENKLKETEKELIKYKGDPNELLK